MNHLHCLLFSVIIAVPFKSLLYHIRISWNMYSFDNVLLFLFYGSLTLQYVGLVECKNGDYNERCNYLICQNPQLLNSSEHKMRLLVWWPALDSEIVSLQNFHNFTGCQYNIVSPSNFVYSCTKYTQNEHHPTSLMKSLPQQICNLVLVCTRQYQQISDSKDTYQSRREKLFLCRTFCME